MWKELDGLGSDGGTPWFSPLYYDGLMHIVVGVSGMLLRFLGVLFPSLWEEGMGFGALYFITVLRIC